VIAGRVVAVLEAPAGFVIEYANNGGSCGRRVHTRCVLLACGIRDRLPPIAGADRLTQQGLLRFCAICDGFEAHGKRIAMLGSASRALTHALFFRTFCTRVAVVASDLSVLTSEERALAAQNSIELVAMSALQVPNDAEGPLSVVCADGRRQMFDAVYPVLGCFPETELLSGFDVERDRDGMIVADKQQRTSVTGMFAAGDAGRPQKRSATPISYKVSQCPTKLRTDSFNLKNASPSQACGYRM
jgi:thioredoxin reductase (NADPH)